jgi:hypothetical protein
VADAAEPRRREERYRLAGGLLIPRPTHLAFLSGDVRVRFVTMQNAATGRHDVPRHDPLISGPCSYMSDRAARYRHGIPGRGDRSAGDLLALGHELHGGPRSVTITTQVAAITTNRNDRQGADRVLDELRSGAKSPGPQRSSPLRSLGGLHNALHHVDLRAIAR